MSARNEIENDRLIAVEDLRYSIDQRIERLRTSPLIVSILRYQPSYVNTQEMEKKFNKALDPDAYGAANRTDWVSSSLL